MKSFIDSYKRSNALHHAYLLEGEKEEVLSELLEFFDSSLEIPTHGNPDMTILKYETFGINEGRELKERASVKAFSDKKIFVITFQSITHEAQNSLLKLFEEPTPNTHFFLITATVETFLPTLKSRLFIPSLSSEKIEDDKSVQFAKKFIKSSKPARIKLLKEIIDSKDKRKAVAFLDKLEEELYSENGFINDDKKAYGLTQIQECRRYFYGRAPSVKMLLEHVALSI